MESINLISPSQSLESCSWRTAAGDCSAAARTAAFVSAMLPAQPSPSLPSLSRNCVLLELTSVVNLHQH